MKHIMLDPNETKYLLQDPNSETVYLLTKIGDEFEFTKTTQKDLYESDWMNDAVRENTENFVSKVTPSATTMMDLKNSIEELSNLYIMKKFI